MKLQKSEPTPYEDVQIETILASVKDSNIDATLEEIKMRPKVSSQKYCLFIYVVGGCLELSEYPNRECSSGSGFFVPFGTEPPQIHAKDCSFRVVYIWDTFFRSCCDFVSSGVYEKLNSATSPVFFSFPIENVFCLENCFNSFLNSDAADQITLSKGIIALLISITTTEKDSHYENYPAIIKKILSILNFVPNIIDGIPSAIYELGYSKNYICRIFKKHTGMTVTNYITDRKLKHSIILFHAKHSSVSEVCEMLNIKSIPYFTKIFTQKFGITPAKYRNHIMPTKND